MAWSGYFEIAGNEIINASRTEAYAADLRWFRPLFRNPKLASVLDHSAYVSPSVDEAPWYSANAPESADFCGVYPLSVSGLEDSTTTVSVIESLGRGGTLTKPRAATKTPVFNLVLVASTERGVEYGWQWFKHALEDLCADEYQGMTLCYLASEPVLGPDLTCEPRSAIPSDPETAHEGLSRNLRRVRVIDPAVVTAKYSMVDGGAAWVSSMTLVAGLPFEFGLNRPIVTRWLDPLVANPWPGGVTPTGGSLLSDEYDYDDVECPSYAYAPVTDPLCPSVVAPPTPPGIQWGCFDPPSAWTRRALIIPETQVSDWGVVEPIITVVASAEMRNVRIRLFPDISTDAIDLGGVGDPGPLPVDYQTCGYCVDLLVSYIPPASAIVLDGGDQVVYVEDGSGRRRRADSLVFDSTGGPLEWGGLTCGVPYMMTLDVPVGSDPPVVTVELVSRSA